ncbi:MAG TPA: hypothetical protein VF328_25290 [Mycobacterium sp.]
MTTPPIPPPSMWDYPPPPPPAAPASPFYLPSLIAALVASVAIVIGSSAPWVSVMVFSANGTVGDGKFTLALGLISAAALLVASFGKVRAFGYILAVAVGVLVFAVGVDGAIHVTSQEKADFFGTQIGAEIGWGLWLVLIASVALIVTASVAFRQIPATARE